eukprot:537336-Alexandrium_andersonii.AAC.1
MMCVDAAAIIGSANWATASRADSEVGVLIDLKPAGHEKLVAMFEEWMASGLALRGVLKVHAQQT